MAKLDLDLRISDNIRRALNIGTTLTTRFWLSWASILHGLGFLFQQQSWLRHPSFTVLNEVLPMHWWGVAFLSIGCLGMWRVVSPVSRVAAAWATNFLVVTVWATACITRLVGIGPLSLLSVHTVLLLMALWCMSRTEATDRDKETA